MTTHQTRKPVSLGEPAPDFALPDVSGTGTVSLAEYRGNSAVFLGLMIGLWCPFCRRAIAQIAANQPKLKAIGVETVGVVATPPETAYASPPGRTRGRWGRVCPRA
jgi:peroxiredoxin